MSRLLDRPTHRPGLNPAQLRQLAELERAPRLSGFDRGSLAAWRLFGTVDEADRAERVLAAHDPVKTLTAIHEELERSGNALDSL